MHTSRLLGWAGLVVGAVLLLIGAGWGRAGFYESQAPILLLLVVGGGGLAVVSALALRKPKQPVTPVKWRPPTDHGDE